MNNKKYTNWDGACAREDPQEAFLQDQRKTRRADAEKYKSTRVQHIDDLREARLELYHVLRKKPPPFDEFTVFGLPSDHGIPVQTTTRDCMTHDDRRPGYGSARGAPNERAIHLQKQISTLEKQLRVAPIGGRPGSARNHHAPMPPPPQRPPSAREARLASPRRPVTSISAYRDGIGLDEQQTSWLGPNAMAAFDTFRGSSKAEEQMLLGFLKSARGKMAPRPLWKLKRFEAERPRSIMNLPELNQ